MKLNFWALVLAFGLTWALVVLFVGTINWFIPGYGRSFLYVISSIYPGYHAATGGISVIVGTVYAFIDGMVGAAIFVFVHNLLVTKFKG